MKFLITGAAGFIGSQLAASMVRKGHDVVLVDDLSYGRIENLIFENLKLNLIQADVRDKAIGNLLDGVDIVFHLAAISSLPACQENPVEAFSVNVEGTINLLEASRKVGVKKFIFSSTSAVYENTVDKPFSESSSINPNLSYSLSKAVAEQVINSYVQNYGLTAYIVRFFNIYGPHQDFLRVNPPLMAYICRTLAAGERPIFFSSGEQQRDYVYVDDVVRMLDMLTIAELPSGTVLNACANETASVKEIFGLLSRYFVDPQIPEFQASETFWEPFAGLFEGSNPLKREVVSREVNKVSLGSYSLAKKLLGWEPLTSLEEGTKSVASFALSNMDRFHSTDASAGERERR